MGRKARNKVKEYSVEDSELSENEIESVIDETEEKKYEHALAILRLRSAIMNYVKDQSIPMCEYLSNNSMTEFVNWALYKSA